MLFDTFIYPVKHVKSIRDELELSESDDAYLIECDSQRTNDIEKHIKKFKLRSKINIRPENGFKTWWVSRLDFNTQREGNDTIGCIDLRAPGMGLRIITQENRIPGEEETSDIDVLPLETYNIQRMMLGIAEGQDEIFYNASTPLECNLDIAGAVDFKKGCYIGQELTARTHHTGVVRKRIVPVQFYMKGESINEDNSHPIYDPEFIINPPKAQTNVIKEGKIGRQQGKICASLGNIGLANIRLDTILAGETLSVASETDVEQKRLLLKAFIPAWWPKSVLSQIG